MSPRPAAAALLAALALALLAPGARAGINDGKPSKPPPEGGEWSPKKFWSKDGLEILSNESHTKFVSRQKLSLVVFCTSWSKQCKETLPALRNASKKLNTGDVLDPDTFGIATVDVSAYPDLEKRWGVLEYPTFRIHKGWHSTYEIPSEQQPRGADEMLAYMKRALEDDFEEPDFDPVLDIRVPSVLFSTMKEEKLLLLEFYAPWCEHCKTLASEFRHAARVLKPRGVKLAKVDGTASLNKPLLDKYGIEGFPELLLFRNGEPRSFTGLRDLNGIVTFMAAQALPRPRVYNVQQLENASKTVWEGQSAFTSFIAVHVVDPMDGLSPEAKAAASLVDDLALARPPKSNVLFLRSEAKEVATHLGGKPGELVLYPARPFRKKETILKVDLAKLRAGRAGKDGKLTSATLLTMLDTLASRATPTVGLMTPWNTPFSETPGFQLPLVVVFCHITQKKSGAWGRVAKAWQKVAMDVAAKFEFQGEAMKTTVVLANAGSFKNTLADFGLPMPSKYGASVGAVDRQKQKYRLEVPKGSSVTKAGLEDFIEELVSGTLSPYLKSAPKPTAKQVASTKTELVVGSTFQKTVVDSESDVLINFFAPWCTLCETLDPEYEQLALKLAGVEDMVVAKMDASANDMPAEFEVGSLPAMFLSFANNALETGEKARKPMRVEIAASKATFVAEAVKFLRNHSSADLSAVTHVSVTEPVLKKKEGKKEGGDKSEAAEDR